MVLVLDRRVFDQASTQCETFRGRQASTRSFVSSRNRIPFSDMNATGRYEIGNLPHSNLFTMVLSAQDREKISAEINYATFI